MTPLIALAGRSGPASRVSRSSVSFAGDVYTDAILRAGGEPVILVPQQLTDAEADELIGRFDGLVLMGGGDVDPQRYGQVQSEYVYGVSPEQDAFETTLACAALRCNKPVLAICRGMQVVNVALGGTLVQEIATLPNAASQLAHKPENFPEGAPFAVHDVDVEAQSRLAAALERATGKSVNLKVVVDPNVLGGLVATVGDEVIDGSVRTRLDQVKSRL